MTDYAFTPYEMALIEIFNITPSPSMEEAAELMCQKGFETTALEVAMNIMHIDNLQLGDN